LAVTGKKILQLGLRSALLKKTNGRNEPRKMLESSDINVTENCSNPPPMSVLDIKGQPFRWEKTGLLATLSEICDVVDSASETLELHIIVLADR
jgi:hypothetical protein